MNDVGVRAVHNAGGKSRNSRPAQTLANFLTITLLFTCVRETAKRCAVVRCVGAVRSGMRYASFDVRRRWLLSCTAVCPRLLALPSHQAFRLFRDWATGRVMSGAAAGETNERMSCIFRGVGEVAWTKARFTAIIYLARPRRPFVHNIPQCALTPRCAVLCCQSRKRRAFKEPEDIPKFT